MMALTSRSSLIWVCTVCPDLSVRKLRITENLGFLKMRLKYTTIMAIFAWNDSEWNEPRHEKTYLMPYAANKGTDKPAHPRSLISAFIVRCLDNITPIGATSEIWWV